MSTLVISLLGHPHVEVDGAPVEVDTRKAVALLARLAVTGRRHARDELAGLLWPEQDQQHARGALRRTLSTLRSALGGDPRLLAERETIALAREGIELDVARFRELLGEAGPTAHPPGPACAGCLRALREAADLYRADFMAGFFLRDAPEFDDWQIVQSEALRSELGAGLEHLARADLLGGRFEAGLTAARRWLTLDPLHEPAHRTLMELYARAGNRAAALRQFRDCVRVLDAELGVGPLEETVALFRAVETDALPPLPSAEPLLSGAPVVRGKATGSEHEPEPDPSVHRPDAAPLMGREREMATLRRAHRQAAEGFVVLVEGEGGIGKTRLARELLDEIRAAGGVALESRCFEGEANLAYGPFVGGLRAAFARLGPGWLEAVPPHARTEAARLVPELGEARPPSADRDPGAGTRFLAGVTETLLRALTGDPPGALLLDDLHWADPASIELLLFLVRRAAGRPGLLVLAWRAEDVERDHPLRRVVAEAVRERRATSLSLAGLDLGAVTRLAERVAPAVPWSEQQMEAIHRQTDGNPFLVLEALEAAADGDVPEGAGDEAMSGTVGSRALLRQRVEALPEPARQVLGAAAVLGRSFDFATARQASGRSEEETTLALQQLVARRLLRDAPEPATGAPGFEFEQERVRLLVYEDIGLARRLLLHRRAARSLAARAGRRPSLAALAAHHYLQAGRDEPASEQFVRAGLYARSVFANREAMEHLRSAIALGHPDAAVLQETLGDLHTLLGEYREASEAYRSAAALHGDADLEGEARLAHRLGNLSLRLGDVESAEAQLRAAASALAMLAERGQGRPVAAARLEADRSLVAHIADDGKEAAQRAVRALELAEAAGDPEALAQAHNILGILATHAGDPAEARTHLERSLALAGGLPDPSARVAALNNLALAAAAEGDLDTALSRALEALDLCARQGDRHRQAALHNNVADLLHAAGRAAEAMDHLKRAVAIFAEVGEAAGELRPEIWKLVEW